MTVRLSLMAAALPLLFVSGLRHLDLSINHDAALDEIVSFYVLQHASISGLAVDFQDFRPGLEKALADFRKFRQSVSDKKANVTFAQLCSEATGENHIISCGYTMKCFMRLFASVSPNYVPTWSQTLHACQDSGYPGCDEFGSPGELRFDLGNMDNSNPLFLRFDLTRKLAEVPLQDLTRELLSDDAPEKLPRIFQPCLQWNRLAKHPIFKVAEKEKELLDNFVYRLGRSWLKVIGAAEHSLSPTQALHLPGAVTGWLIEILNGDMAQLPQGFTKDLIEETCESLCSQGEACQNDLLAAQQEWDSTEQLGFSKRCPILHGEVRIRTDRRPGSYQNHIFGIVKRSNDDFAIIQGYIGGYDLTEWFCSRNKYADPNGFSKETMQEFLQHLASFVQSSSDLSKGFDSANHRAVFDAEEKDYDGFPYLARFAYNEVGDADINVEDSSGIRETIFEKAYLKEISSAAVAESNDNLCVCPT